MGKVKTGYHVCRFIGGPICGETKKLPDDWLCFRIPTLNTDFANVGAHLYIRDEDDPSMFYYEGLE